MDVDAPLALKKTENELTIEKAVSTCAQKTMKTGVEKDENLQTFEHIPGLEIIVEKQIMELGGRNTQVPDNVINETVLTKTNQIPELELNEVDKRRHHDLKDSQKIRDKTELCLSVDSVGSTQANLTGIENSLKIKETNKIDLRSIAEQQMMNDEIVDQMNNIVPNKINEDKTIEHINAEDAKMKEVIADAYYHRSENESIKSQNNALNDTESINNDNCVTFSTTPTIQERCRMRDPENNYREQSRKGEKKYREFAEIRIKNHNYHHATSRKAEENIKSGQQKEREHCENKNHDVNCERNGKREDHERNRSPSRSRHHSRREDNTIQRANPKTNYLKKRSGSRLRSPKDKKCDNYTR